MFFLQTPQPQPRGKVISQYSTFSEHGHIAYQIKGITKCSNIAANILHADPLPPPYVMGLKGQNSTYSDQYHVAYQIKGNHECSSMAANIFPAAPPPPTLGMGSIGQNSFFFQNMVRSKRSKGVKGQNSTYSDQCHVAYQIKWNHKRSN